MRGCCRPASRTRRPPSGASSPWSAGAAWASASWKRPFAWPSRNWTPIITIEAQAYAQGFYEKLGFVRTSDEFDDGGIMHVEMKLAR
ncbi:MAG: GNAT family N-acetyltransferase [Adlercreutzia sp.]